MARPPRKRAQIVRWPYDERVDSVHGWGTVAAGVAIAGIIMTVLVTLNGSHPHFLWWWPTNWMILPIAVVILGLIMLIVPLRRHGDEGTNVPPGPAPSPVTTVLAPVGEMMDSVDHSSQFIGGILARAGSPQARKSAEARTGS